jgi:hypothetical protein
LPLLTSSVANMLTACVGVCSADRKDTVSTVISSSCPNSRAVWAVVFGGCALISRVRSKPKNPPLVLMNYEVIDAQSRN